MMTCLYAWWHCKLVSSNRMTDILCVVYTLPQNAVWWPCLLNARRYGGHAHRMRAGMVAMLTECAPVWWTCSQNACRYGGHAHWIRAGMVDMLTECVPVWWTCSQNVCTVCIWPCEHARFCVDVYMRHKYIFSHSSIHCCIMSAGYNSCYFFLQK